MKVVSQNFAHGGVQGVYTIDSVFCNCEMTFAVYLPPQAKDGPCPVLWYLSGLTCNHSNVMDKGEYRKMAAELGLIIVCPDTSPRGEGVPDELTNWQMGKGAGFYLNATEEPWSQYYQMESHIIQELPKVIKEHFPVDMDRQGITGHSMGGHGALTLALKNPDTFKSCSAFAPIAQPMTADWSRPALEAYLGSDESKWRNYDATALIEDGAKFTEFLVDQGEADNFLENGLRPWLLEEACKQNNIPLTLRMHANYDHSYFFISSLMDDHLKWHKERLS
jgi:S-formylglutathione hydrolase